MEQETENEIRELLVECNARRSRLRAVVKKLFLQNERLCTVEGKYSKRVLAAQYLHSELVFLHDHIGGTIRAWNDLRALDSK
jgi:hypothetical protein